MTGATFCFPRDLLDRAAELGSGDRNWTCVQTRPRWEKKFSQWLVSRRLPHFLPLVPSCTKSHRKVHHSEVPLFPGYVFVRGGHAKRAFSLSGCVVRILLPGCEGEAARLDEDLRGVHDLLAKGVHPASAPAWKPGQRVRILSGPLADVVGEFVRFDDKMQLIVRIDLLGIGAAVNLDAGTQMETIDY
jgi:transcription antitermination factor NusG